MSRIKILIPIIIILIFSILISYFFIIPLFSNITTFSINSYDLIDDDGFPSLKIDFNSNNIITLNLEDPNNKLSHSEKLYSSQNEIIIPLAAYRENPDSGDYQLKVYDINNKKIYDKSFNFMESKISIISVGADWFEESDKYSLLGLKLNVKNNGDIPIYPYFIDLTIEDKSKTAQILPTFISPGESKFIFCYIYIDSINFGEKNFDIKLYGKNNELLEEKIVLINTEENTPIKHFSWEYEDNIKTVNIPLPQFLHDYYIDLERFDINDYGAYVFDEYDDNYLSLVGDILLSVIDETDDISKINLVGSFVQYLDYQWDDPSDHSYEYPRFPVEILDKQPCDCEDKSILAANLLKLMGYNVSLLDVPFHMAIGVNINQELLDYDYFIDNYYYLETTYKDYILGDSSGAWPDLDDVTIYPITSRNLMHHKWKKAERILNQNTDIVNLKILIENLGNKPANNIKINGAFYSSDNNKLNQKEIIISSLEPGEKDLLILKLNVPQGKSTILKTQLYVNNILVEEKESETKFS